MCLGAVSYGLLASGSCRVGMGFYWRFCVARCGLIGQGRTRVRGQNSAKAKGPLLSALPVGYGKAEKTSAGS